MSDELHTIRVAWRAEDQVTLHRGECSCDWVSKFETTEKDLVVEEVKVHVAELKKNGAPGFTTKHLGPQ